MRRCGWNWADVFSEEPMAYTQIALCIVGMSLYFNAGKLEARGGGKDHSILWAALSLMAQAVLFLGIALVRVLLDRD